MGNCFKKMKMPAEIVPSDDVTPSVLVYGSPASNLTLYIRIALSYKPVRPRFIPSETPSLRFGPDLVSGSPDTLLRCLDAKFPQPVLVVRRLEETTVVGELAVLQHKSMRWHLGRMVRWGEDMATRGRGGSGRRNPVMGSARMEMKKLEMSYSKLLEVMLEHAQMEERIVFSLLDKADRGLCKAANAEHARDLPLMNGIKEDIKSIGVLDLNSPVYHEALLNLSARLKTLQEHCTGHFEEEETELLPLMEAAEMHEKQNNALEQFLEVMSGTHSHLFRFFIEGLLPHDAMHYLDLISRCNDTQKVSSMLKMIIE